MGKYDAEEGPIAADALNRIPEVLLVEDEDDVRDGYQRHLVKAGFSVTVAETLAEARDLVTSKRRLDVAVLDYNLPDGFSLPLVGDLLQRRPLCKSLVVTGTGGGAVAVRFMQAGAHEYLEKPTKPAPFINAVIGTLYASLEWRLRARQPLDGRKRKRGFIAGTAIPRRQGPPPLALHPPSVLARLRYLGCLDATQTLIALRLLWGDSDRQIAQFLGCAERTAKRRVSKVLTRIGAGGRSGVMGALMRDAGFDDSAPPQAARLAVCSTKSRPGSSNQTEA